MENERDKCEISTETVMQERFHDKSGLIYLWTNYISLIFHCLILSSSFGNKVVEFLSQPSYFL